MKDFAVPRSSRAALARRLYALVASRLPGTPVRDQPLDAIAERETQWDEDLVQRETEFWFLARADEILDMMAFEAVWAEENRARDRELNLARHRVRALKRKLREVEKGMVDTYNGRLVKLEHQVFALQFNGQTARDALGRLETRIEALEAEAARWAVARIGELASSRIAAREDPVDRSVELVRCQVIESAEAAVAANRTVSRQCLRMLSSDDDALSLDAARRACKHMYDARFPDHDARCSAHGHRECEECHRNPANCKLPPIDVNYATIGCGQYSATGMHWDTCPNRIRGPLTDQHPKLLD